MQNTKSTEASKRSSRTFAGTKNTGCGYELGKINVVFTGAEPKGYEYGAPTCEITANIRNYSKHHLNKLIFEVGTWRFEVGDMVANSYEDDVLMSRINLGNATC